MATIINLNDTTPAPVTGHTNVKWQGDASTPSRNVSAYMPLMVGDDNPSSPLATPESGAVPAPAPGDAAAGKFLKADGTWTAVANGAAVCETPSGTMNGINLVFTLSYTPLSAWPVQLMLNGVIQSPGAGSPISGADYTISGATITYTVAPLATDFHFATYEH